MTKQTSITETVPCLVMLSGVSPNKNIKIIKELNENEFNKFKNCANRLLDFSKDNQLIKIIILNHAHYTTIVDKYKNEHDKGPINPPRLDDMHANVNMCILNFVTSNIIFLKHSETSLKRKYGKTSAQVEEFLKLTNKLYDDKFSYRFFYKFRNYTQHCGMPTTEIGLSSRIPDSKQPQKIEKQLIVQLNRDELIDNYDSWGPVKTDLKSLPTKFAIDKYMNKMFECIKTLKFKIITFELNELNDCARFLVELLGPVEKEDGTPFVMEFPKEKKENAKGELKFIQHDFNLHIIEQVREIIKNDKFVLHISA